MSVALAVLADRLQRAVPQRDGAPADYERLAGDAMQQLGADLPAIATSTIQVVAGTAAVARPTDFPYAIPLAGGAPGHG